MLSNKFGSVLHNGRGMLLVVDPPNLRYANFLARGDTPTGLLSALLIS